MDRKAVGPHQPTPLEWLVLAYSTSLAVVSLLLVPAYPAGTAGALAVCAGVLLLPAATGHSAALARVHHLRGIGYVLATFFLSAAVGDAVGGEPWDLRLAATEERWFGGVVEAWRGLLGRPDWLTDAASFAYGCYYPLPVLVALALRRRSVEAFEVAVFALVATFSSTFALYLLFPAAGPRVAPEDAARVLGGGAIAEGVRRFLAVVEPSRLDAFPSGHAAIAVLSLLLAWRELPRWRVPVAILAASIVFSTVYLSLHYLLDVLAGAALSVVLFAPLLRIYRALASVPAAPRLPPRTAPI